MADQPIGYQSPAFNLSGDIQGILEQQRLIQRQAMLDALNQKNVQSEIAARDENTAGLTQQRQAHAGELEDESFGRKMALLPRRAELNHADPTLVSEMIKRGVATPGVDPQQGAQGTSSINVDQGWGPFSGNPEASATGASALGSTTSKTTPTYNGSPKEQEQADQQERAKAMSRMDMSKYEPWQRFLMMRSVDPTGSIPNDIFKPKPSGHVYMTGPDGKLVDTGVPSGTDANVVHNRPNAPRVAQPRLPQIPPVIGTANDDQAVVVMTPDGPKVMPMPAGTTLNGRPTAAGPKGAPLYDNTAFNLFSRTRTNQNATDDDIRRSQANVINTIGGKAPTATDMEIRQFLPSLLWDPDLDDIPPGQIQEQLVTDGNPPEVVQKVMDIYSALHVAGLKKGK